MLRSKRTLRYSAGFVRSTSALVRQRRYDEAAGAFAAAARLKPDFAEAYNNWGNVLVEQRDYAAALAHFHGPLTIGPSTVAWKVPPDTVLTTGNKPGELQAHIGTMSERHRCWVVVVSHTSPEACSFADGVRPKVTIEFPAKEPGAPAIIEHYSLDGFC